LVEGGAVLPDAHGRHDEVLPAEVPGRGECRVLALRQVQFEGFEGYVGGGRER